MKKYIITACVCFTLGGSTLLYFGVIEDAKLISQTLVAKNEQALEISMEMANEELTRVKLDTEIKKLEFEVKKQELEIELDSLTVKEVIRKEELELERRDAEEWAWWVTFAKIFWLLGVMVGIPAFFVILILLKIAISVLSRGEERVHYASQ